MRFHGFTCESQSENAKCQAESAPPKKTNGAANTLPHQELPSGIGQRLLQAMNVHAGDEFEPVDGADWFPFLELPTYLPAQESCGRTVQASSETLEQEYPPLSEQTLLYPHDMLRIEYDSPLFNYQFLQ